MALRIPSYGGGSDVVAKQLSYSEELHARRRNISRQEAVNFSGNYQRPIYPEHALIPITGTSDAAKLNNKNPRFGT